MTLLRLLGDLRIDDIRFISCCDILFTDCGAPRRDSRTVQSGDVFFCLRGASIDGHDMIADAVKRGASCVIVDDPRYSDTIPVPWVCLYDVSACYLSACLSYYEHPEQGMTLIAVTGTNGKTSVVYMIEAILSADPRFSPCAVFGTVENRIAGVPLPSSHTTPPPEELARLLAKAHAAGVRSVILEASSHALEQNRLAHLRFSCGIFTNLTEDHLDYHKTMENYFQSKRKLFSACDLCLFNTDDPHGKRLADDPTFSLHHVRFAVSASTFSDADIYPSDISTDAEKTTVSLCSDRFGDAALTVPLSGTFVAANLTAAAACCRAIGVPWESISSAIRTMHSIPGRMERLLADPFYVFLDYAHTPDALSRAIRSLHAMRTDPTQRVLVLFGCGGDRERQKRPMMGAIASTLADVCIITSDNSRSEDPFAIISDIMCGVSEQNIHKCQVVPQREEAICVLLSAARKRDLVLLAGKGHETYQIDRQGKHPFSERSIVSEYIEAHKTAPPL